MIEFMSSLRSNYTLLFFITYYPIRKNIFQVINYNWIKTIKREQTFGKISILTWRNQENLSLVRFFLSGSILPFTLQCSSSHLVVVQLFTWFNRHKVDLYRFHWNCCACGALYSKLICFLDNTSVCSWRYFATFEWVEVPIGSQYWES